MYIIAKYNILKIFYYSLAFGLMSIREAISKAGPSWGGPVPAGGYIYRGPCLVRHGLSCDRCNFTHPPTPNVYCVSLIETCFLD